MVGLLFLIFRLRSAGCRGVRASARWVPFAAGVCKAAAGYRVCGGGVRASELLAVQFKKLSQTVRPFIRECILYYGV